MKIGMYSDEEILEHLTEGEGRGFLGRSMYDAIMEKIKQQENQLQQKENIIKEVREYVEENWISQKDADNYRFDDEELNIEISDIAVLFDVLDKENK